jgi:hypothetical protein
MTRERVTSGIVDIISWQNHWCLENSYQHINGLFHTCRERPGGWVRAREYIHDLDTLGVLNITVAGSEYYGGWDHIYTAYSALSVALEYNNTDSIFTTKM